MCDRSIQLIVDEDTTCFTNVSASEAVQENDVIVMTCSVTYSGNWAPVMRWFNSVTHRHFTDDDITLTTSNTTVTSQLTITASADLHGSQVVCVTYFAQPLTPLSTDATNVPSYTNTWTSPTLNVIQPCKYNMQVQPVGYRCCSSFISSYFHKIITLFARRRLELLCRGSSANQK